MSDTRIYGDTKESIKKENEIEFYKELVSVTKRSYLALKKALLDEYEVAREHDNYDLAAAILRIYESTRGR